MQIYGNQLNEIVGAHLLYRYLKKYQGQVSAARLQKNEA